MRCFDQIYLPSASRQFLPIISTTTVTSQLHVLFFKESTGCCLHVRGYERTTRWGIDSLAGSSSPKKTDFSLPQQPAFANSSSHKSMTSRAPLWSTLESYLTCSCADLVHVFTATMRSLCSYPITSSKYRFPTDFTSSSFTVFPFYLLGQSLTWGKGR